MSGHRARSRLRNKLRTEHEEVFDLAHAAIDQRSQAGVAVNQACQFLGQPALAFTLTWIGRAGRIQSLDLFASQLGQKSQALAGVGIVVLHAVGRGAPGAQCLSTPSR